MTAGADLASAGGSPPRRWASVLVVIALGVAIVVLAYVGLFVVPLAHSCSFHVPDGACAPPTTGWELPRGSHVSGTWAEQATARLHVNITGPDGSVVHSADGVNGTYAFETIGSFSLIGAASVYTVRAWPPALPFGPRCAIFPTVTFSGTYTAPPV